MNNRKEQQNWLVAGKSLTARPFLRKFLPRKSRLFAPSLSAILMAILLLSLAACGGSANLDEPPEIRYGQDVCDECNMIISEERFSASYVTNSGEVRRFDEIGDMLVYIQRNEEEVHIYWVHDLPTETWIDAAEATYTISPNLVTPMGWGLAAFADQAAAENFAAENEGQVTTWSELLEAVETGALDPTTLATHFHDHGHEAHNEMEMEESMDRHDGMGHEEHVPAGSTNDS